MGLSGSRTDLSMPAALYHPGEPRRCIYSLLHDERRASPALDRVAILNLCIEAVLGSLALRLTSSLSKASTRGLLPLPLGQLHGERVISMFSSFQLNRSVRLRLTHQISPIGAKIKRKHLRRARVLTEVNPGKARHIWLKPPGEAACRIGLLTCPSENRRTVVAVRSRVARTGWKTYPTEGMAASLDRSPNDAAIYRDLDFQKASLRCT